MIDSNNTLICPICGKKTWLRIQNGEFLEEYPIRINCMNCKSLLRGKYNTSKKIVETVNAKVERTIARIDDSQAIAVQRVCDADYCAEVSGELPCRYVSEYICGLSESIFLRSTSNMDSSINTIELIERLRFFQSCLTEWQESKSIPFQLLQDGSIEFISTALHNRLGKYKYDCTNNLKSISCLQEVILFESKYLFYKQNQTDCIKELLNELSKIERQQLLSFIEQIGGVKALEKEYRKAVEVFSDFMNIYPNVLPAEMYFRYNSNDTNDKCLSTCAFSDIKTYYLDTSETLASLLYIPICLDNILLRGDCNIFSQSFENILSKYKRKKIKRFRGLPNRTKIDNVSHEETIQHFLDFSVDIELRNGIGHNNYSYDSICQIISLYDLKKNNKVNKKVKLIEMAIECIGMAKTTVLLSEIIFYLMREGFRTENICAIIHPDFYKGVGPNEKCPCGSSLKFKNCCMHDVKMLKE